ncbi:MAG: hypothetical protein K0S12_737 [Bacteroidetes bacterium]|jgi:hypothetical protein|nr:hypothetical protein [Bacteroidota bacterium]
MTKSILLIFSLCIGVINVFGQKKDTLWRQAILHPDFKTIGNAKEIDSAITNRLPELKSKHIANPNEKFNATDNGGGPRRRLYFAGFLNNRWIISYEHGGRGYHEHTFFITISADKKLTIDESLQVFQTFQELKNFAFKNDTIIIKSWNHYDY